MTMMHSRCLNAVRLMLWDPSILGTKHYSGLRSMSWAVSASATIASATGRALTPLSVVIPTAASASLWVYGSSLSKRHLVHGSGYQ